MIHTLSLFLIGSLHIMIFSFFSYRDNFLLGHDFEQYSLITKCILYGCAVSVAFCHQFICRRIGLKRSLILGLFFNVIGLTSLLLSHLTLSYREVAVTFLFLDMIFFGVALTSVINSLISYVVLEFSTKLSAAMTALFIFFNLGVMLSPLTLGLLQLQGMHWLPYPILIGLLFLSIWYVSKFFFDPVYPPHIEHLRKSSLIWIELHYRLVLIVLAVLCYGMIEDTFSEWGYLHLRQLFGETAADKTNSIFWLFEIIGQVLLIVPLFFIPVRRIFFFLIAFILAGLILFPLQTELKGFLLALMLGGIGCSAIFPLLLSMIEGELKTAAFISHKDFILPYIETGTSAMVGFYFTGIGIVEIWVDWAEVASIAPYFYLAIGLTVLMVALVSYFNWTRIVSKP